MSELYKVTTNRGTIAFNLCCPRCGNRDWDEIDEFPAWKQCHHCNIRVKAHTNDHGYLDIVVLIEDR